MKRAPGPFQQIAPILPWRRLAVGVFGLLLLLVFGVVGYMLIEDWSFSDALYMTVITITTVGFSEVEPLSDGGQVFTIFVVLFGVLAAFFILTTLVQTVVEGEFAAALGVRRMQARLEALRDHYILCGFGRVGEAIAGELLRREVPFVVIDNEAAAVERIRALGCAVVQGDATLDAVLESAGIRRARVLLASADSDAVNTYITLTAKALNPDLFVVSRVGQPASEERVRRAGADRVISPYNLAGRRMALSALQPLTVDFFDVLASPRGEQLLAELVVTGDSLIEGKTVQEVIGAYDATTLLAVQHPDGVVLAGPPSSYVFRPGDRLMLLSNEADMEQLGRTKEASAPVAQQSP